MYRDVLTWNDKDKFSSFASKGKEGLDIFIDIS